MFRRINQALPGLLIGIFAYGVVVQLTGVWFVQDKLRYTTGLWMGIAIAAAMAVNMAIVILDSVDAAAAGRPAVRATLFSVLRYALVVLAIFLAWRFRLGNPVLMFVGVMGLKVSAYLQPFAHKLIAGFQKSEESTM